MEYLFSIGKFAKMCNTTVDTLNHYEHLGLLSPAYINETHRRCYDIRQYYITFKAQWCILMMFTL